MSSIARILLAAAALFVLLHVLPYLLGCLAVFGAYQLHQAFKDRQP